MSERTITVHAFCSVKGGVGKSTLAVVCARLLAARGRVSALLDCDFTGTSIADGLRLRAPQVALHDDGTMDLDAAPTGPRLSVEETMVQRAKRGEGEAGERPPPYLNDLLDREEVSHLDGLFWQHEQDDGVLYLPSSSIHRDIIRSLNWLYTEPFDWVHRFTWFLDDLVRQVPGLNDIVIDLPPGVWGFSHEILVLLSNLSLGKALPEGFPAWHEGSDQWRANPLMITSTDNSDLLPAIEYIGRHRRQLPTLRPIVNRSTEGIQAVRARTLGLLGATFRAMGLEEMLVDVPESAALARLFKDPSVPLDDSLQRVATKLRIEVA